MEFLIKSNTFIGPFIKTHFVCWCIDDQKIIFPRMNYSSLPFHFFVTNIMMRKKKFFSSQPNENILHWIRVKVSALLSLSLRNSHLIRWKWQNKNGGKKKMKERITGWCKNWDWHAIMPDHLMIIDYETAAAFCKEKRGPHGNSCKKH